MLNTNTLLSAAAWKGLSHFGLAKWLIFNWWELMSMCMSGIVPVMRLDIKWPMASLKTCELNRWKLRIVIGWLEWAREGEMKDEDMVKSNDGDSEFEWNEMMETDSRRSNNAIDTHHSWVDELDRRNDRCRLTSVMSNEDIHTSKRWRQMKMKVTANEPRWSKGGWKEWNAIQQTSTSRVKRIGR